MKIAPAILLIFTIIPLCQAFHILGIFTSCTKSHDMFASSLMRGLHRKGHNITVLTGLAKLYDNGIEKFHLENLAEVRASYRQNLISKRKISIFQSGFVFGTIPYGVEMTETVLASKNLRRLISSNQKFDVIIMEDYFNEALLGLSTVFSAPVILLRAFVSPTLNQNNQIKLGFSPPMSFSPSIQSTFSDRMSFLERLNNVLLAFIEKFGLIFHMWLQERLYESYFNDPKPNLPDVLNNVSFILQNSHESLFYPQPSLPNFQDIGGLHISSVINPLPERIQKFIDQSDEFVYFSLGGNIDFADFSIEKQEAILNALEKTKFQVLLKTRKKFVRKFKNIIIKDWYPQNDILANPKIKAFVNHGGLQSYQEAVFHAVPIIGIPIYGDHVHNIASAVNKGVAIHLDYGNITEPSFMGAIQEITENHKYKKDMVKLSRRYHDRQVSPLENAIYWIEYVAKYEGAVHLRNAGVDLNWIQYYCLDVFGCIFLIVVCFSWVIIKCLMKYFKIKSKID